MNRLTFLVPVLALFALAACETMQGAGRDLEAAGEAISDEAAETQAEM